MANEVTVRPHEVVEAQRFLSAYLSSRVPEGNFKPGTHLYDVVIKSFSYVIAYIRAEALKLSNMQTLAGIGDSSGYSIDSAVDSILSNWFVTRRDGTKTTGIIHVYFDTSVEAVIIPASAVFTHSEGVTFTPISESDTLLSVETNLTPVYDASNTIESYYGVVAVEAEFAGIAGELPPAEFESWSDFSEHATSVSSPMGFSSSAAVESSAALIQRAKEAITSRDFLSSASLKATLLEDFSTISSVTSIGAGDSEMMRDRVAGFGESVAVHGLGQVNVYTSLAPISGQSYSGIVDAGSSTISLPVGTRISRIEAVGVRRLTTTAPNGADNTDYEVTDYAESAPTRVSYRYNEETGKYTYVLGGRYATKDSGGYYTKDSSGAYQTTEYTTPLASEVVYSATYDVQKAIDAEGTYTVSVADPVLYNTSKSEVSIDVGVATYHRKVTVMYSSYTGFETIDAYLQDSERRILASDMLGYCKVAATLKLSVKYLLSSDAPGVFPEDSARVAIAEFVNNFDEDRTIRAADIVSYLTGTFPTYLASISFPLQISYLLETPDGRAVEYCTEDSLEFDSAHIVAPSLYSDTLASAQQVSRRTVDILCFSDDVTIEEIL